MMIEISFKLVPKGPYNNILALVQMIDNYILLHPDEMFSLWKYIFSEFYGSQGLWTDYVSNIDVSSNDHTKI